MAPLPRPVFLFAVVAGFSACDAFSEPTPRSGTGGDFGDYPPSGVGGLIGTGGGVLPTADSDGDGLSDEMELTLGTSPYLRDSDGDGCEDPLDTIFPECDRKGLFGSGCDGPAVSVPIRELALAANVPYLVQLRSDDAPGDEMGGAGGAPEPGTWTNLYVFLGNIDQSDLYLGLGHWETISVPKMAANGRNFYRNQVRIIDAKTEDVVQVWWVYSWATGCEVP